MEVSSSTNSSQSLALAAYSAEQQQAAAARPRDREEGAVDPTESAKARRGDNVSFSSEALRLSTQTNQDSRSTVNRANESEASKRQQQQQQEAASPELVRAEGAKTFAQAINAYRDTSII